MYNKNLLGIIILSAMESGCHHKSDQRVGAESVVGKNAEEAALRCVIARMNARPMIVVVTSKTANIAEHLMKGVVFDECRVVSTDDFVSNAEGEFRDRSTGALVVQVELEVEEKVGEKTLFKASYVWGVRAGGKLTMQVEKEGQVWRVIGVESKLL
jgi:hypothetical protein